MSPRHTLLPVAALLLLAACAGPAAPGPSAAAPPALETFTVGGGGPAAGQGWDGVVEAVQQAVLSAQTTGRVSQLGVDVNDRIAAGQVLLRLTAVEQQALVQAAAAQLASAEAVLAEAQSRFKRSAELVARQLVSRADHELALAARDSAVAARDAAKAGLEQAQQQQAYTVVRAPYAGIVSARHVQPGEAIVAGQALLEVYAPGALRIQVQIPQTLAPAVRAAGSARVQLPDGRQVAGTRLTVYPSADPLTHAVTVRVELPALTSPPAPGTTARVLFPVASDSVPLRVPLTAVVQRGEVSGVYVLAGNQLTLRQVRLGEPQGGAVEVITGLAPGEHVARDPLAATKSLAESRGRPGVTHE